MKTKVTVHDIFNNKHEWEVESREKGREYAKRIITEGLWFLDIEGEKEVFYPVHQIVKVELSKVEEK